MYVIILLLLIIIILNKMKKENMIDIKKTSYMGTMNLLSLFNGQALISPNILTNKLIADEGNHFNNTQTDLYPYRKGPNTEYIGSIEFSSRLNQDILEYLTSSNSSSYFYNNKFRNITNFGFLPIVAELYIKKMHVEKKPQCGVTTYDDTSFINCYPVM